MSTTNFQILEAEIEPDPERGELKYKLTITNNGCWDDGEANRLGGITITVKEGGESRTGAIIGIYEDIEPGETVTFRGRTKAYGDPSFFEDYTIEDIANYNRPQIVDEAMTCKRGLFGGKKWVFAAPAN